MFTTSNIRRVAAIFCEEPDGRVNNEHQREANECAAAKQELVAAQG